MIIGIGCDIVEHGATKSLKWETDPSVLNRIFSKGELDIFFSTNDLKFLSGRFAAKEAIVKCLGTGMEDGIALPDIQVLQLTNGKPVIELSGEIKRISQQMEINLWHISITHSTNYSLAFVTAEKAHLQLQ